MKEELLQYLWQTGLFHAANLQTCDGQDLYILKRGNLNTDAGPDFNDAHIRIGQTEWIGRIEIHRLASEWNLHKHHLDKAYNNTILHVVFKNDAVVYRQDGSELPCLELGSRIHHLLLDRYRALKEADTWVACQDFLSGIDRISIEQTFIFALNKRLERKSELINSCLSLYKQDWQTAFYILLARSFGFGTNSDAFEQLARHLPLRLMTKHRHDMKQTEALVFGVAGFLEITDGQAYWETLKQEWLFLKQKYNLPTLSAANFKRMRMRPGNFPGIRLSQFADLATRCQTLFHALSHPEAPEQIHALLQCRASQYWETHFHLKPTSAHDTGLSEKGIQQLLINAVAPLLYVYGQHIGQAVFCERAYQLLENLPAENNHIIRAWKKCGVEAQNAFDSQALLQLKTEACAQKLCLSCPIGQRILKSDTKVNS